MVSWKENNNSVTNIISAKKKVLYAKSPIIFIEGFFLFRIITLFDFRNFQNVCG